MQFFALLWIAMTFVHESIGCSNIDVCGQVTPSNILYVMHINNFALTFLTFNYVALPTIVYFIYSSVEKFCKEQMVKYKLLDSNVCSCIFKKCQASPCRIGKDCRHSFKKYYLQCAWRDVVNIRRRQFELCPSCMYFQFFP